MMNASPKLEESADRSPKACANWQRRNGNSGMKKRWKQNDASDTSPCGAKTGWNGTHRRRVPRWIRSRLIEQTVCCLGCIRSRRAEMIDRVDRSKQVIGKLSSEEYSTLIRADDAFAAQNVLERVHARREWLRCAGRVVFHVREGRYLARNPRPADCDCEFCTAYPRSVASGTSSGGAQTKPRELPVLLRIMERSSFCSLERKLPESDVWVSVSTVVERGYHLPDSKEEVGPAKMTLWTPIHEMPLQSFLADEANWRTRGRRRSTWAMCYVEGRPRQQQGLITVQLGEEPYVSTFVEAAHRIWFPRSTGPYMCLVEFIHIAGRPEIGRLVAQAVASRDRPVPVDSNWERIAVEVCADLGPRARIIKPIHPFPGKTTLDLYLPELEILIEIQGMATLDYVERKARVHAELLKNTRYRLLAINAVGMTEAEFRKEFRRRVLATMRLY